MSTKEAARRKVWDSRAARFINYGNPTPHKAWISGFNEGYDAGYESAREKWTATKPDYACVFVGKRGNDYSLWNFAWIQGEAPEDFKGDEDTLHYCLAWTNADGDEWDDYEECEFDQYLVIAKLPTMDDIHTETVERIKKRYEREQGGE